MNSARLTKELRLAPSGLAALLAVAIPFLVLDALWWQSALHVASLASFVAMLRTPVPAAAHAIIVSIYAVVAVIAVSLSSTIIPATS